MLCNIIYISSPESEKYDTSYTKNTNLLQETSEDDTLIEEEISDNMINKSKEEDYLYKSKSSTLQDINVTSTDETIIDKEISKNIINNCGNQETLNDLILDESIIEEVTSEDDIEWSDSLVNKISNKETLQNLISKSTNTQSNSDAIKKVTTYDEITETIEKESVFITETDTSQNICTETPQNSQDFLKKPCASNIIQKVTTYSEEPEIDQLSSTHDIPTTIERELNQSKTNIVPISPQHTSLTNESHTNVQHFIIDGSLNGDPAVETIILDPENTLFNKHKSAYCNICHKSFANPSKLNWHNRMHDKNRKRYYCAKETCNRFYTSKQACDLHYRQTHLDEGLFCSICNKVFSVKQTLEVHMRYHTKEFPFACNICDRKFAQKGHLTQHIEVKHRNLRYVCTETDCGKIFQNSVSLKNHRYTHSGMPFKCTHCDKEYPQKNKLRIHLSKKHNLDFKLEDLESMRQFKSFRTRHSYYKVQSIEEPVDSESDNSSLPTTDLLEELDVGM